MHSYRGEVDNVDITWKLERGRSLEGTGIWHGLAIWCTIDKSAI